MTISALVCINNATYGGVYYCANFTTSGAITWTKLTTTGLPSTEITHFRVDYGDPLNRMYAMVGYAIYTRTTGNWSKILDTTIAATAAGQSATNAVLSWLYTDPTTPGSVYSVFMTDPAPVQSGIVFSMKSTDYGATWTAKQATTGRSRIKAIEAIGNNIWLSAGKAAVASAVVCYSPDGGTNFYVQQSAAGSGATANLRINPHAPSKCYCWGDGAANEWTYSAGFSSRAIGVLDTAGTRSDRCWFDPVTANRVIYHNGATIYYSTDNFATSTDTSSSEAYPAGICGPSNVSGSTAFVDGLDNTTNKSVAYYSSPTDTSADERGGANVGTPPYTDSVPNVVNLSMYGIWWGAPPADSGIYVYADELGDITDLPTYTGLGIPLFGDRSSWRDMPADGYDDYHAQDVEADTPQIHAPWDAASPPGAGYGIVSDGAKWVVSSDELALQSDLHDAVTLDVDAAVVLDLNGQEIGLDTQSANTVFAGPATGAANEPTFRALVAADVGTGAPTGSKYLRDDMSWQTITLGITVREVDTSPSVATTTLEFPNGTVTDQGGGVARYTPAVSAINIHTVTTITADTTLTSAHDVVIVDASSNNVSVLLPDATLNDGLTYFIKRIDDSAYSVYVIPISSLLLDSNNDPITDSGGAYLYDSGGTGSDQHIDGEILQELSQYDSLQIVADADAAEWWII